mgnify:CR=1 FL=1
MEGYQDWVLHCLENRWTAKAVGVRFYHPSSKFCKCQQEKVTLVRFLRRTELVEGNGFNSQPLGRVASVTETTLDKYPKWRILTLPA